MAGKGLSLGEKAAFVDSESDDDDDDTEDDELSEDNQDEGIAEVVDEVEEEEIDTRALSLKDKEEEIEKGRASLNQLRIWDSLLEVRIRLQKILLDCNRLPRAENLEDLTNSVASFDPSSTLPSCLNKNQEALRLLMCELMHLQEEMVNNNLETRKAVKEKEATEIVEDPMNEEITSEEDSMSDDESSSKANAAVNRKRKIVNFGATLFAKKFKPEEFQSTVQDTFNAFIPYRNQTIQKWNDKTQFSGGKFSKKSSTQQVSTLKQIEQILTNRERLLKRTQVKRSNYTVLGEARNETANDSEEVDSELFDDEDFYHQLLRELIERKTSNVNDPIKLSHHWLELQKLRTKLKRKVDTKASKGRKIRYDVYTKLVNFMAPQDNCAMSQAAVKELFGSLFGKSKDN